MKQNNYYCKNCLYRNSNKCKTCSQNYKDKYKEDITYRQKERRDCTKYKCPYEDRCGYYEHCDGTFLVNICSLINKECEYGLYSCATCPLPKEQKILK